RFIGSSSRVPDGVVAAVTSAPVILVIGATGRIGRRIVDELVHTRMPVRALTRRPDNAALPPDVEVVTGDLTVPNSLDAALVGIETVFLVWTAPIENAAAAIAR